jgi:hypothetical protein
MTPDQHIVQLKRTAHPWDIQQARIYAAGKLGVYFDDVSAKAAVGYVENHYRDGDRVGWEGFVSSTEHTHEFVCACGERATTETE